MAQWAALLAALCTGCLVSPNEQCDAAGGPIQCDPGFTCDANSGLCVAQGDGASSGASSSGSTEGTTASSSSGTSTGSSASSGTSASSTTTGSSGSSGAIADVAVVATVPEPAPYWNRTSGLRDIAIDPSGTVYGSDLSDNQLVRFSGGSATVVAGDGHTANQDGPGASAQLDAPWGMAFVGTTLYFVDVGGSDVDSYLRTWDPVTGNVSTVCGNGAEASQTGACATAGFGSPAGIAYDPNANCIYIAESGGNVISRVDLDSMTVSHWGGSGQFNAPTGVAVDGAGNVFVADSLNHAIRKIDLQQTVTTFAQMPPVYRGGETNYGTPYGVAVDAQGNVYAVDETYFEVDRWAPDGGLTAQLSDPSDLQYPTGIKLDPDGGLWVASYGNAALVHVTFR